MNIEWFQKQPGQGLIKDCEEGGAMLIIGDGDYIRLPVVLGGMQLKILDTFKAPCPVTGNECKHYALEDGFFVAESDQFYWYKMKES